VVLLHGFAVYTNLIKKSPLFGETFQKLPTKPDYFVGSVVFMPSFDLSEQQLFLAPLQFSLEESHDFFFFFFSSPGIFFTVLLPVTVIAFTEGAAAMNKENITPNATFFMGLIVLGLKPC
jgi:hypothetical protein